MIACCSQAASWYQLAPQSDGLGFRGVIEEEHLVMRTRIAVHWRDGSLRVSALRDLQGVVKIELRKQTRGTLGKLGLAHARRTLKEHVVPIRCGYLAAHSPSQTVRQLYS